MINQLNTYRINRSLFSSVKHVALSIVKPIQVTQYQNVTAKNRLLVAGSKQAEVCLSWLGIFAPDCSISAEVFARVLNIPCSEIQTILHRFLKASLIDVLPGLPLRYRIPSATHLEARALWNCSNPGSIIRSSSAVRKAHAQVLDTYFRLNTAQMWSAMLADEYIHRQLFWHIEQSGRYNLLHTFLQQKSAAGQNDYLKLCRDLDRPDLFTQSLTKAQNYVAPLDNGSDCSVLLQLRYTLIFAILRAQASDFPIKWLGPLLHHQLWSLPYVLNHLTLLADPYQKVAAVQAIAPFLTASSFPSILMLIANIGSDAARAKALCAIADYLPDAYLGDVLSLIQSVSNEHYKALLLTTFRNWPPKLFSAALKTALKLQDEAFRTNILLAWIPSLPHTLLAKVNRAAQRTTDPLQRVLLLISLISREVGSSREMMRFCLKLQPEQISMLQSRLAQLNLTIPASLQIQLQCSDKFEALLEQSSQSVDLGRSAVSSSIPQADRVLSKIAPGNQAPYRFSQPFDFILHLQDSDSLCLALDHLAPISQEILDSIIEKIGLLNSESHKAAVWVAIAHQQKKYLPDAIKALDQIRDREDRIAQFIPLLRIYPELAQNLYRLIVSLENEDILALRLCQIAEFLTSEDRFETLHRAIKMSTASAKSDSLNGLAPYLTVEQLRWGVDYLCTQSFVQALEDMGKQFMAYFWESTEESCYPEILPWKAMTVSQNVQLSTELDAVSPSSLEAIFQIPDAFYRASALRGVLHQLEETQLNEALLLRILKGLSSGEGLETIKVLPLLAPIISTIVGPAALKQIAESCQELGPQFGQQSGIKLQNTPDTSDKPPFREESV